MKRSLMAVFVVPILGLITGCSYLITKPDEPPPLPPIIETKPPLKTKTQYFQSFPWTELPAKANKEGNDPDTTLFTLKEGESLEQVAELRMGNPLFAEKLAEYNGVSAGAVKAGDQIVVPNPYIGVKSQLMIKGKGKKEVFGDPVNFGTPFKKGDHYKLRFETNINGHLYVFRKSVKSVTPLYPAQTKVLPKKKGQIAAALPTGTSKVKASDPVEIPIGQTGFPYDDKNKGDQILVFLSIQEIPALEESLREKKGIKAEKLEDVRVQAKASALVPPEPPIHILRITAPSDILGFGLNIDG